MRGRWPPRSRRRGSSRRQASGHTSCGTTTSSISGGFPSRAEARVRRVRSGAVNAALRARDKTPARADARRRTAAALAYSIVLSLPGTPVIRYGDEIGMGEDLRLKERAAIRTPMQWSSEPNAGFSEAE